MLVSLRIGGAAAAFIFNLVMARTMEADQMGMAITLMSMALLAAIIVSASTEAGTVRFITGYLEREEFAKARAFIRRTKNTVLVLGPALIVFVTAFLWVKSRMDGSEFPTATAIAAAVAALLGGLRVGAAHAMAFGKVIRSLLPSLFLRQVLLLAGVAAWAAWVAPPTVVSVMGILFVTVAVALMIQYAVGRRLYDRLGTGDLDRSETSEWVKVGLQLGLTLIFVQHSRDLTLAIASFSLEPAQIAVLGVATALVAFAKFGVAAINQSITPKIAKLIARDDKAALMEVAFTSNHMKFWPMVLTFVVLALFGDWILGIFGPKFAEGAPLLLILMIEPLALSFFGLGGNYLSLSGHQFYLLPLAAVSIAVLAVAITLGAQIAGLTGAAWGTAIAWIFWSAGLAILTRRISGLDVTMITTFRQTLTKMARG